MFKDEDLHTAMWIPALHMIEGYAPGIPSAGPSSSGGYSTPTVFGCGYAEAAASTATTANLDGGQRDRLDKKVTELRMN